MMVYRSRLPMVPFALYSTTAHILSLKVTFVTDNERAFARVSGLKLADWAND